MAISKTVGYLLGGASGDYTTFALYDAAWGVDGDMPTTFTQDQNANIWYSDNANNNLWAEQFLIAASLTMGDYSLSINGMVGDIASGDQCTITAGDGCIWSTASTGHLVVNNMGISRNTTAHGMLITGTIKLSVFNCGLVFTSNASNRSVIHYTGTKGSRVEGCFIRGDSQIVYANNGNIYNTIVISEGAKPVFEVHPRLVSNCTLISKIDYIFDAATVLDILGVTNTIMYCKELWSNAPDPSVQIQGFNNNCVYQTDYTGKLWGNNTGAELWGPDLADKLVGTTILSNPLFTNGSTNLNIISDFALQSGSPCRQEAITQVDSPLYSPSYIEAMTIGAWPYFDADFPERANVLTTDTVNGLAGTLTPDYPEAENVTADDTTNGVAGTYVPDFPTAANTLTTDTTNNVQGTWTKADKAKYQQGETFGNAGSELGTYAPAATAKADFGSVGYIDDTTNLVGVIVED